MFLRRYRKTDCSELACLFYDTVHTVNAADYTKEQLDAWANGNVDLNEWHKALSKSYTIVAVEGEIIIGFGNVEETGYLDMLFIHKDYQRKGIANRICDVLERECRSKIFTARASVTAKPFFEARGYRTTQNIEVCRNGVYLKCSLMEKCDK